MSFCRICLQPGPERTVDLDATLDAFYDELLYYDVIQHSVLTICTYCEHLLRKAYNIRQRCRRAHILLKLWTKDTGKKVPLNFLWKHLPKNPIAVVSNNAVQKVFAYIDREPEIDTGTTIDNEGWASLVPIPYKQETKPDIKSYYQGFLDDAEIKLNKENNTDDFDNTANDFENADPNRASDNESDVVFNDNFDDFFKSEVELLKQSMNTDDQEQKKEKNNEKRKELRLIKKRERSRALLEEFIAEGSLKDLELDDETMLKWFDMMPMGTLLQKGVLNPKYHLLLDKWRDFFQFLKHRYDPKYEAVFDIEFLQTHEQKVAEFVARQHSEQFIKAPCKCFICFKVLSRRGLMEYHNKVWHDESLPIKCDICLCGFQNTKQLKNHMQKCHEVVYRCKHCSFIARNRNIMILHYEEHANNGIFCNVCGKQFRTVKTMTQHLLCHKRGACCPFCARFFAVFGLATHTRCKHKDDPLYKATPALQCPECDSTFHYEDALNIHIQRDHKEYRCSCGELFLDYMSLCTHTKETKHIRIKSETKRDVGVIRCDVCSTDIPFTSSFALHSHHRSAHPTLPYICRDKRKSGILCEFCGLACVVGQEYEDHLNTHSGEKPYECSECGTRFETRALAEHHLKMHAKNKEKVMKNSGNKYECRVCSKEFSCGHYLRQHIKIHEDFNREIVTSRVVMPKFKIKTEKPNTLTKIDSVSTETLLQTEESKNDGHNDNRNIKNDEILQDEETCMEINSEQRTYLQYEESKNDGHSDNGSIKSDEILQDEETYMEINSEQRTYLQFEESKNDGLNDNGSIKSNEILQDKETCMEINSDQRTYESIVDLGMEVIFDFDNDVVEEVVL